MNNSTVTFKPTTPAVDCHAERRWHAFLFPSVFIYLFGLLCILTYRLSLLLLNKLCRKKGLSAKDNAISMTSKRLYNIFGKALHGHSWIGLILNLSSACFIIISIIIYLIDTTTVLPVERPFNISREPLRIIDLICNLFYLVYFIPKFMASYDKLNFWLTLPTFADVFTIQPIFSELALRHWWIGMRWVCFFRMLTLTDLLESFKVLKTATQIRLAELVTIFFCVWLSGAGYIHLVENSGSPSMCYKDVQPISYWNSFYLILITMSTVGYGDIFCKTIAGKIFIMFYIIFSVALFASYVPEIIEIVASTRDPYNFEYIQEFEIRTVIVGGNISYNSIKNFAEDFTHPDRATNNFKSIIFDNTVPSAETLTLVKAMAWKMEFIKGSVYEGADLNRIKFKEAEAYIILTNLSSCKPDEEDMSNIMKAIAAKKHEPRVRVILQLIKQSNKSICFNLPCWTDKDQIICLTEINNGFMAAGCLVPGFSTLITNLFLLISKQESSNYADWQRMYLEGAEMEIYSVKFSQYFHGKPLNQVILFCYKQFKLLLVGVTNVKDASHDEHSHIIINPGGDYFITNQTIGLFFSPSEEDTQGVKQYCPVCHPNMVSKDIRKCNCPFLEMTDQIQMDKVILGNGTSYVNKALEVDVENPKMQEERRHEEMELEERKHEEMDGGVISKAIALRKSRRLGNLAKSESLDITGCYHWCVPRELEDCILPNNTVSEVIKDGRHIIVYTQELSPGSLRCFVLPLRTSRLQFSQLKTIVFLLKDLEDLEEEWSSISTFPNIYVSVGSPMNRSVLRGLNITQCHMFVVVSGVSARMLLDDSQTILITLNTKSITSVPMQDDQSNANALKSMIRALSLSRSESHLEEPISILTEISDSKSIKYVDMDQNEADEEFYCTRPYACGKVFISRVFDTLTTSMFFSPESYKLAKVFITGTDSDEQELLLAEGISQFSHGTIDPIDSAPRCSVELLPLSSGVLNPYMNSTFEHLFLGAYSQSGILCIGLFRLIKLVEYGHVGNDRFVLTSPQPSLQLDASDLVYCLCYPTLEESESE